MKPLPPEQQKPLREALARIIHDQLDVEMSTLKTQLLYDALMPLLGHAAYNQALADAHATLQTRLIDMEIDLQHEIQYEPG